MSEKYYRYINQLVKIGFDNADDPDYCDMWDTKNSSFQRRNDILDDVLNHPETQEIEKQDFEKILSRPSGMEFSR